MKTDQRPDPKGQAIAPGERGFFTTFPLLLILFSLLATSLVLWFNHTTERQRQDSMIMSLAMDIQVGAAEFHLWFEEYISGNTGVDADRTWGILDDTAVLAETLLSGGETHHGRLTSPLEDPELRERVRRIGSMLEETRALGHQLALSSGDESGAGSALRDRFDDIFRETLGAARDLEMVLIDMVEAHHLRGRALLLWILGVWLSTILAAILGIWRLERRRRLAAEELRLAHAELEERVEQRTKDLTEEVAERRRAERSLTESEEKYRAVVESAQEAVIVADENGDIFSWNMSAQSTFGYTGEEALGRPLTMLMPERYRDDHRKGLERFRRTGKTEVMGKAVCLHGLRKDGSEFPLDLSLSSWETEGGRFYSGIIRDTTERVEMETKLERLATTDKLTGAYNRARFDEIISLEMERAGRFKQPLSVIIFDLDNFKYINDTFGHLAGDHALKSVADILRAHTRKINHLVRWGGDEFVVITPGTDAGGARVLSERLRRAIEDHEFDKEWAITASFGVARLKTDETGDSFLKRADDALYRAKAAGGNRVESIE